MCKACGCGKKKGQPGYGKGKPKMMPKMMAKKTTKK
jgi:hypothetical protein